MLPYMSMITLGVSDLARSRKFYAEGLGFPQLDFDSENVAFFTLQGAWLGLYGHEALAEDAQVDGAGQGFRGVTIAHNVQTPEEVDAVLKTAQDAGATVTKPAEWVFWGGYSGYFADPDGHLWEVAYNPHLPVEG